jgi:distribution and morphology protein 31
MLTIRTTFVSAVFATLNSLSLQEYVARWISDYLTSETGVTVMYAYPRPLLDR